MSFAIISYISKQDVEIKELITRYEYRHQGFGTKTNILVILRKDEKNEALCSI